MRHSNTLNYIMLAKLRKGMYSLTQKRTILPFMYKTTITTCPIEVEVEVDVGVNLWKLKILELMNSVRYSPFGV